MTEIEGVDRPMSLDDGCTWRLLLTQLHRDDEGNPESLVLAYAIKRVSSHGECLDGSRTRHQSRKTKPFLKTCRGAMRHCALHTVHALNNSLLSHKQEFDRSTLLRPMSGCILGTPGPPARPEL